MSPDGVISGGWGYVWAAYLITWLSLGVYAGSIAWREHKSRNTHRHHSGDES